MRGPLPLFGTQFTLDPLHFWDRLLSALIMLVATPALSAVTLTTPLATSATPVKTCPADSSTLSARAKFPASWWQEVPKTGAPAWEIMPQEAGAGEVILSKRGDLGILSNFAATTFILHGKHYNSIEGFWQMMKYPEGPGDPRQNASLSWVFTREAVSQMVAFEAKRAGDLGSENMKKLGIGWVTFEGKQMEYKPKIPGAHYAIILEALWAKVRQNEDVKRVLLATCDLKLRPDHLQESDAADAWKYNEMWMKIRSELKREPSAVPAASK